ncbi:MAG: ABC transporter ATP-binding protein [Ferrimonas sp.]
MNVLDVQGLHCHYQQQPVLTGVTFGVAHNQVLALLGASGCGKSTLLRALAGLQAHQGRIELAGQILSDDQQQLPPEQRRVGLIFQDYALFPHLSVAENVAFGLRYVTEPLTRLERQQRVQQMLALVQLEAYGARAPHQLSGGQQQRVAIARALAPQPRLLLLDEPFSNIDMQVRAPLMAQMRQLLNQLAISAIVVTHSKSEAFAFADEVALLEQGQIIQQGTPERLYRHPSSSVVADFLGASNYIEAKVLDAHRLSTALGELRSTTSLPFLAPHQGQLLLRPQQLYLQPSTTGNGVIIERHFGGSACNYWVQVGALQLQVHALNAQWPVGQRVAVQVHEHELVLF